MCVGTELKKMIPEFLSYEGCSCKDYAKKMDRFGIDWCEKNKEQIVSHLVKESKKTRLGKIGGETLSRIIATKWVNKAINICKEKRKIQEIENAKNKFAHTKQEGIVKQKKIGGPKVDRKKRINVEESPTIIEDFICYECGLVRHDRKSVYGATHRCLTNPHQLPQIPDPLHYDCNKCGKRTVNLEGATKCRFCDDNKS